MAVWLAKQVGESGHVVATDIDLTYLQRLHLPNLEVRRHNILDDPLDALGLGSFDLVCSRLMLFWLAGKQETAIQRMASIAFQLLRRRRLTRSPAAVVSYALQTGSPGRRWQTGG